MIVLIGFMGAGKTTVGRLLADELGLPFVDTDRAIEIRSGMSIPTLFAEGEGRFRALEREVVAETLAGPESVVSLGGGAVGDPATAAELEWKQVVHLDVSLRDALDRVGKDTGRPMLSYADPKALFVERQAAYRRIADLQVETSGKSIDDVVVEVLEALGKASLRGRPRRVEVSLRDRSYAVTIGTGLVDKVGEIYPEVTSAEHVLVLTHPGLGERAEVMCGAIDSLGVRPHIFEVPEGEGTKSLHHAEKVFDAFAEAGAHRNDVVIGFGGGVICDLAGFVASTFHRGMRLLQVPSTLLGQVDAAIGGKNGVNLTAGKNLVGTFHQPEAVICDVSLLSTLPEREVRSGLAEVAKYGFISDPSLLDLLETEQGGLVSREPELMTRVVARSVEIKSAIVSADERDRGIRAFLNYGHTVGHAIEHSWAARDIRHGEAISLGMVAAALIAEEMGFVDGAVVARHREVLGARGLPVTAHLTFEQLEPFWKHDKKFDGGLRFVLLKALGRPTAGVQVPAEVLERALQRMGDT